MSGSLRIAQWNARSIKSKIPELLFRSNNFDLFIISETWLTPLDKICIKGFDVVRQDRFGYSGRGVLILIRSSLRYQIINVIDNCQGRIEVCAINLFTSQGSLTMGSIHRPPRGPTLNFRDWHGFLSQLQDRVFIGGDFNLREECRFPLLEAMLDVDLVLLNNNEPTHFDLSKCVESSLDLSIISSSLAVNAKWEVSQELWRSDHYPLFIFLEVFLAKQRFIHRKSRKLYSKRTDWDSFKSTLKSLISENENGLKEPLDVQNCYKNFTACITSALETTTPGQSKSPHSRLLSADGKESKNRRVLLPPCPWWDKDCDRLIRIRSAALSKFKLSKSREDFLKSKKAEARARVGPKKDNFIKFYNNLRKDSNPSYIWRKMFQKSSKFFRNG